MKPDRVPAYVVLAVIMAISAVGLYAAWAPKPSAPVATAAAQLAEQADRGSQEFQLSVNYVLPLPEAIAFGKFILKNDGITLEHFPPSANEQGIATRSMRLFSFGRIIVSSEDAIAGMSAAGYRPATLRELLAFAALFPEKQRACPIVALGSVGESPFNRHVPYISERLTELSRDWVWWRGEHVRDLDLHWWSCGWHGSWRFLAVRKS